MKYLLERKHFQAEGSPSCTVVRSPSFISNGHWMLHKSKVMNFDMFSDEDLVREYLGNDIRDLSDETMENLQRTFPEKKWIQTNWEYHHKVSEPGDTYSAHAFRQEIEGGEILFINSIYVELFHIHSYVYADGPRSPVHIRNKDMPTSLLVMPMRINKVPDFIKDMLDGLTQLNIENHDIMS